MDSKSSIKVVGVGLPRTGTASLQRALVTLGFGPCHHMQTDVLAENFPYRKARLWQQVFDTSDAQKRQALIKSVFDEGGFNATVDFPPSLFVEDLLELYPDAKFILSVRKSPEVWRESFNTTLNLTKTWWFHIGTFLLPSRRIAIEPMEFQWDRMNARLYEGAQIYDFKGLGVYEGHNHRMKRLIPKNQLLVHDSSQGWGPICKFLGVEVPKEPYPHANDREEIRKWFYLGAIIGTVIWCCWIAAAVGTYKFWTAK